MKTGIIKFNLDAGVPAVLKSVLAIRDKTFDRTRVPMARVRWVPLTTRSGYWQLT